MLNKQGNVAWEKIVLWILGIIVLIVLIVFMVSQLGSGEGSVVERLFGAFGTAGKTPTP